MSPRQPETRSKVSLLQVILSVGAAFFGVQSEKNRARDFGQGSAVPYIVVGVIMTLALVGLLWGVVALIVRNSS